MGLKAADFVRTLPNAVGDRRILQAGLEFLVEDDASPEQRVRIRLTEQPERRIASLSLPVARVEFEFEGFGAAEQAQFLQRFDLYFQKGGG